MYHLPLANSQAWGVQALVAQILPLPGSLLPKSLEVGSVILHHHHCLLAALPQFSNIFCTVRPGSKVPSCAYKACTITLRRSPRYALVVFMGITWEEKVPMFCFLGIH